MNASAAQQMSSMEVTSTMVPVEYVTIRIASTLRGSNGVGAGLLER